MDFILVTNSRNYKYIDVQTLYLIFCINYHVINTLINLHHQIMYLIQINLSVTHHF